MTQPRTSSKSLIALPAEATSENPVLNHAVSLLVRNLPQPVDVLHLDAHSEASHQGYARIVYVGRADQLREALGAGSGLPQLEGDAHCCVTFSKDPLVICLAAGSDRGVLYAASELCRAVKLGTDLSTMEVVRKPLVPLRMAYMCASTHIGKYFRPGLFDEAVEKLAHLGANGVFVMPEKEYGTPAGMDDLPFRFQKGEVVPVGPRVKEWQHMLDRIKSYGHEIYVLVSAWIPPDLEKPQVRDYYDGKTDIPDYEAKASQTMHKMLSAMFEHLPQIDGVVLHSLERTILWGGAVSIFPTGSLERSRRALETYLAAIRDCCSAHGKNPCFWPHAFGVDTTQLLEMRRILARFPDIVNLEDSYWNNGGWPFLPIMGYLPDDLRRTIHRQNRFGMFTTSTDNENFGSGSLPALNPVKLFDASREACERKAEVMIVRINRCDRTSLGTFNNICGVNVEASLRALWSPAPDMDQIWDEWSRLRFGRAGASATRALKLFRRILLKGFSLKGFHFMSHESIPHHHWTIHGQNFRAFGRPGVPLLQKDYEDLVGAEFQTWQLKLESFSIGEFRTAQDEARQAVAESRQLIEGEAEALTEEDREYLFGIYDNAEHLLKAIRLLGEASYAMNLVADNFDDHPDPVTLARETIRQLDSYAQELLREKGKDFFAAPYYMKPRWKGKEIAGPSLAESLLVIADRYRDTLSEWIEQAAARAE